MILDLQMQENVCIPKWLISPNPNRAPQTPLCTSIKDRPADSGKSLPACNDHIVIAAGAMQNENISPLVPAADDPNVSVLRVKDQIPDLRLRPGNAGTGAVLRHSAAAMTDDVLAVRGIVKHPVHEPRAIQAVGPVSACGTAARRRNLREPSPAAVPAQDEAFYSDR